MTCYFVMINAWSLAWEALYGDMDKEYPIKNESYDDFENPLPPQDVDMVSEQVILLLKMMV